MITIKKLMFVAVAGALLPAMSNAQELNQGYLTDTNGKIVMSGSGLCWQHRDMDMPSATGPCAIVPPVVAAAPAKVAVAEPAVKAPPPVVVAAAKPTTKKISFSGDALFAFDKAELKPEGKTMLDGLARQLEGATYENIVVTGHTDRFGSAAYNQKLSERRAHSVKDYLTGRQVLANRIDAHGKGETQPVTKAGDCRGVKSAKVVACLQADRRVDVVMTGTMTVTGSL